MKPIHSVIALIALVLASAGTAVYDYNQTRKAVISYLDKALGQTLSQNDGLWLTPDTLRTFRRHLCLPQLKCRASIGYCLNDDSRDGISSSRHERRQGNLNVAYKGYANCSMATILAMSDQHRALTLLSLSVIWGIFALCQRRKTPVYATVGTVRYGGITYNADRDEFTDDRLVPIHFTPMQHQLMQMFFRQPTHRLSQQEICQRLWPKKPDATETLHTLIRRTKTVVEAHSSLHITVDRGRSNQLDDGRK